MKMPGSPHFLFDKSFDLAPVADGLTVSEVTAAEYLEAKNGRLKMDVPHVRDELKVEMVGTVPESWGLL
jgi:hypothetical protein